MKYQFLQINYVENPYGQAVKDIDLKMKSSNIDTSINRWLSVTFILAWRLWSPDLIPLSGRLLLTTIICTIYGRQETTRYRFPVWRLKISTLDGLSLQTWTLYPLVSWPAIENLNLWTLNLRTYLIYLWKSTNYT